MVSLFSILKTHIPYLIVTNMSSSLCSLVQSVVAEVPDILLKCVNRDEAALAVAQKVNHGHFVIHNTLSIVLLTYFSWCLWSQVFKSLYDNTSNSGFVMWSLATLVAIRDVCKLVVKELTNWVCFFMAYTLCFSCLFSLS